MPKQGKKGPLLVDLCCGAGGMSYGFRRAGWSPVLGIDTCENSAKTYEANLKVSVLSVDLLDPSALKTIKTAIRKTRPTAVIGGPPCQGFSQAGPRNSADPRNEVLVAS